MYEEKISKNISIYRKERGLTQEELAQILGLSFQAVSKWANART
ncbi:XRE family transcriptional regulator, partial [Paenibacillus sp. 28ISP30-2]|nr:XRE family transcriptional regulator [Paenibacillus sp. 28ISP30-2]